MSQLQLETKISAKFHTATAPQTPAEQANLDALNHHAEDICRRLQDTFKTLILEMLDMKREFYTTPKEGGHNEGSDQAPISSDN